MADKKAASPAKGVILRGVILVVALIVVLAVLCVWLSGSGPAPSCPTTCKWRRYLSKRYISGPAPSGPTITVTTIDTTVDSGSGPDKDKNISCMVDSVSRPDVKWDDLVYAVLVNESAIHATVEHESIDKYVSHGDTVIVTYNALGDTARVKLMMVYIPTASTPLEWSVICT